MEKTLKENKEIKNLREAGQRILQAVEKKERIILYGDTDLDGVTSVIILKETLKNLGQEATAIYFPDREVEGYGITKMGLENLKNFAPGLLITLDLGISSFSEVDLARNLGFEVMIIDHHEILDQLPSASIIVDPKQPGDEYPFKGLATAGIVFKLSEFLLAKKSPNLRKNFLELVALATIADMMPKEDENLIFIEEGLADIENSFRPGIRAFFELERFKVLPHLNQKIAKIISLLNIRDIEGKLPASYRLLTTPDLKEAFFIIEKLLQEAEVKREKIKEIIEEVERRILEKESPIIFEGDEDWELTLISSVASNLCQKYQKPVFIFKKLSQESQGTVRTPSGIDSVALMKKCKENLISFGGHSQASGFRIKNENLEKFRNCLIRNILT
jgi:single-stranded-DNA-specific exonuclease